MKPEEVHPSHEMYEFGYYVSEVMCVKCKNGIYTEESKIYLRKECVPVYTQLKLDL